MKTQLVLAQALATHFDGVLSFRCGGIYWFVKMQNGDWACVSQAQVTRMIMHRLDSQGELYERESISGIRSMLAVYLAVEGRMPLPVKLSLSPSVCPSPKITRNS